MEILGTARCIWPTCAWCGHYVNGVSKLHSQIIKDDVFHEFYRLMPEKFGNVTNGIASRRWLMQSNPRLDRYIRDRIGEDICKIDLLTGCAHTWTMRQACGLLPAS